MAPTIHQLLFSVVLPLSALFVMLVMEALGSQDSLTDWLINASHDTTIAAFGMSAHLFGDAVLMQRLGEFAAAAVLLTVFGVLLCVASTLHLKRTEYFMNLSSDVRVTLAMTVGFLSIAVVAVVASWGVWGG